MPIFDFRCVFREMASLHIVRFGSGAGFRAAAQCAGTQSQHQCSRSEGAYQPMAQQPAWATPLCETGPSIQVGSGIVNPNIDVSTMANGSCSVTVAIVNPNAAMTAMISARGTA